MKTKTMRLASVAPPALMLCLTGALLAACTIESTPTNDLPAGITQNGTTVYPAIAVGTGNTAATQDLLTAGLGKTNIGLNTVLAYADPLAPTALELRRNAMTVSPDAASFFATAKPRPRLPPVTRMLRMPGQLPGGGHGERRHKPDRRRHFPGRELITAHRANFFTEFCGIALHGTLRQHDVGRDDRAHDRTAPTLHQRHAYCRMTVDDGLDLFGIHLLAADVDDAAAAAEEEITLAAALDEIAGVDETVAVVQRVIFADIVLGSARRAYAQ